MAGFLGICIWELIKQCIDYRKICKEEKRLQEERRRGEERKEEDKQREVLITKIEMVLNERLEIIAQLLKNLSREHSDDSGNDYANYGDTDIDDSETGS